MKMRKHGSERAKGAIGSLTPVESAVVGLLVGLILGATVAFSAGLLTAGRPQEQPAMTGGQGEVAGLICSAEDRVTPIPGAAIEVLANDRLEARDSSREDGSFELRLPAGDYILRVQAEGYVDFQAEVTVRDGERVNMETILLVASAEGQEGTSGGDLVNSMTGSPVGGAMLTFMSGWNNFDGQEGGIWGLPVGTATTDENGHYETSLPVGYYTAIVKLDGFLPSSFNIIVRTARTMNQNGTVTPRLSGEASEGYMITLTWGENPKDLDSHVQGRYSNGQTFHVYYRNMNGNDGGVRVCSLDCDDTTSYGPEHITLNLTTGDPYYYYVYLYAGEGTLSGSGAKVTIHRGNVQLREFNVPANGGNGRYWNVFAIQDGNIVIRDTITEEADLGYAG